MHTVIDTSYLQIGKGGEARYITCLIKALRPLESDDFKLSEIKYPLANHEYAQPACALKTKSRSAAENMLAAHPDLNGMFASSEPSSVGASLAIKSRGLADQVWMVAFDSSDGMIEDLKSGAIDAMVVQDPFKIGYDGVKTLVEFLNGKTPPKQIDLNARVLMKEDLDKPDVKKLLSPELDKYLK